MCVIRSVRTRSVGTAVVASLVTDESVDIDV